MNDITVENDGKIYDATWSFEGGYVTIFIDGMQATSKRIDGDIRNAPMGARQLLREIIRAGTYNNFTDR